MTAQEQNWDMANEWLAGDPSILDRLHGAPSRVTPYQHKLLMGHPVRLIHLWQLFEMEGRPF
jgi:hypothetical protein